MHSLRIFLSRYSLAIGFAFVTSTGLVLLMEYLIRVDESGYTEVASFRTVEILRKIEDIPPVVKPPVKEPVEPPEIPPPPPQPVSGEIVGFTEILPPPKPDPRPPVTNPGTADGDLLSILKVAPIYPTRAQTRGIEGYVIIQFTVDELGRVVDPIVIDAMPTNVFDRAALDAVRRYKYKPRVINGSPMIVPGVKHRVTFELTT